uniref:YYY membrane protein n=1 Tax=Panagrellus redivivus TaxID=6233 RepID=A0A7E4W6K9_PANRE
MPHISNLLILVTGVSIAVALSVLFAYYMFALHEARLWFSNIQEVEREISFRTESGLYYSFYKEAFMEPTWSDVVNNLLRDQFTEAPIEINILKRFNVYQELVLAWFYTLYDFIVTFFNIAYLKLTPIFFYTYSCFVLSGLALGATFGMSWSLSGNFLFGTLTAFWTFADIDDATRVFFTVNLRENFALPFFWFANVLIIDFLQTPSPQGISISKSVSLLFTTFLFSLFWQFNQFILLLQSGALIATAYLFPGSVNQIVRIFGIQLGAYLLLIGAQFGQSMLLGSLYLWIAVGSVIILTLLPPRRVSFKTALTGALSILAFAVIASSVTKTVFSIDSDTHIWTFVKAKLGLIATDHQLPFETALYICHGAFAFIDSGFWTRTTTYGMLPLYGVTVIVVIGACFVKLLKPGKFEANIAEFSFFNAAVVFMAVESVLVGLMAVLTLRMKYVWFPHVAVLGAHGLKVLDPIIGKYPKYAVIAGVSWLIATNQYGIYKQQVANEQEFYDPDTVALMKFISTETTPDSIFSGSMQLMAGIRCCTTRPIANHPHFEDAFLRARTERLYTVYGTAPLTYVHTTLCHEGVDYIVLEDSICLAPLKDGCSTNEIVDAAAAQSGRPSGDERVCQAVKAQSLPEVRRLFKQVFENRTFRVYRVNCRGEV